MPRLHVKPLTLPNWLVASLGLVLVNTFYPPIAVYEEANERAV